MAVCDALRQVSQGGVQVKTGPDDLGIEQSESGHDVWLWRKTVVTTASTWVAWSFGLVWFIFVGRVTPGRFVVFEVYLVLILAYILFRTSLVTIRRVPLNRLSPGLFLVDFCVLGAAGAISGGTGSPFLPVFFMMPISGALIYGTVSGIVSAVVSCVVLALSGTVAHLVFRDTFDGWQYAGQAIWLVTVGVAVGLMSAQGNEAVAEQTLANHRAAVAEDRARDAGAVLSEVISVAAEGAGAAHTDRIAVLLDGVKQAQEELTRVDCGPYSLSLREKEVLSLMVAGHSHAAIAASLFITVRTVKEHATHIYRKLGVETRHQAVMKALSEGLVQRD